MIKYNTLKFKLILITISTIIISNIFLTVSSIINANKLIDALPTNPALGDQGFIDATSIIVSANTVDATLKQAFDINSILMLNVTIVVAFLITYFLVKKEIEPLEVLTKEIENRSIDMLAEEILTKGKTYEIVQLTKAFNTMSYKLNDAYTFQKNFNYNVAHELKTPVAILKNNIEVYQFTNKNPELNNMLDVLYRNTNRLEHLIADILALTNQKIEKNDQCAIKSMVDSIIDEYQNDILAKNIQVTISGDMIIKGNRNLLLQMLKNLIENSIKYNIVDGFINIDLINQKAAIIKITNSCTDMSNLQATDIFMPFVRLQDSSSGQNGGSGLGLSIAKNIAQQHLGSIEYQYINNTICFTIKL